MKKKLLFLLFIMQIAAFSIFAQEGIVKGKVIDEVLKGYLLNDKVLRYAKVVVGS